MGWRMRTKLFTVSAVFGLVSVVSVPLASAQVGRLSAKKSAPPAPKAAPAAPAVAPVSASAAAPATTTAAPASSGGKAQRQTTYDFEDDLVTGDLVRPDGELLTIRKRGNRSSLIKIREHFIPEMLKSVENL